VVRSSWTVIGAPEQCQRWSGLEAFRSSTKSTGTAPWIRPPVL
jgi:hypothetical protein